MKNRILAIFLLLLLSVSAAGCGTAAAQPAAGNTSASAQAEVPTEDPVLLELPKTGVTIYLPEELDDMKGLLLPYEYGELRFGSDIYAASVNYVAMTLEEYGKLVSKQSLTQAEYDAYAAAIHTPCLLLAVGADQDPSVLEGYLTGFDAGALHELAENDGYSFYRYDLSENAPFSMPDEYGLEYRMITDALLQAENNAEFHAPDVPYRDLIGKQLIFETTDMDGNPVNSADLFSENNITLLNVWTSWCGPCKQEIPGLQKLDEELDASGCGVIGLLFDGTTADAVQSAKQTMEDSGAVYPVVLPPGNLNDLFPIQSFPTSFFVDDTGTILSLPAIGAPPLNDPEEIAGYYLEMFDVLLKKTAGSAQ